MKRYSEVVLNGHPDKFCDLVADRLIREAYKTDPQAYAQIEVAVWSDIIFLNGAVVTNRKIDISVAEVIHELGYEIGYTEDNYINVDRYKILDHICWLTGNPRRWTDYANDQSIVIGYAGYDALTRYLPPEHFLCWYLREELVRSMETGGLEGQGPDGKLLVIMLEENNDWKLDTVLVTMQQKESISFMDFTTLIADVLRTAYEHLQIKDDRWIIPWADIKLLINPNGPLINGGSDGDNGQTGRKLVMDFYGPRIPIGGGAIYGKDLAHIDRIGANMARRFALEMVRNGSKDAVVKICFAPGMNEPLSIDITSNKRSLSNANEFFLFSNMKSNMDITDIIYENKLLGTFYNEALSFNLMGEHEALPCPDIKVSNGMAPEEWNRISEEIFKTRLDALNNLDNHDKSR